MWPRHLALGASMLLLLGMVLGFLDNLHSPERPAEALDLGVAASYSQEYDLSFSPLGGPEHLARALELNKRLTASIRPDAEEAMSLRFLLGLQRALLEDAVRHPGTPKDALAILEGAGGGRKLAALAQDGSASALRGLRESTSLATNATGYAQTGIGWAPSATGLVDYWRVRASEWEAVQAQALEAHGAYGSFFATSPAASLRQALHDVENITDSIASRLYAVPLRVGEPATAADVAGHLIATARKEGVEAELLVGLDSTGSVSYCTLVQAQRHCRHDLEREVAHISAPARLGIVSASTLDDEADQEGGRVGLFNPASRPTGHLELRLQALDGSWNSTTTLGPVPADGARFATFPSLGDGAARLTVLENDKVVLEWIGEIIQGLGLVIE